MCEPGANAQVGEDMFQHLVSNLCGTPAVGPVRWRVLGTQGGADCLVWEKDEPD